jgi:WD40 repeat protein
MEATRRIRLAVAVVLALSASSPAGDPPPVRTRRSVEIVTPVRPPAEVFPGQTPAPLTLSLPISPLRPATAVAFSPTGKVLACGSHGLVTLWDLRLGQMTRSLEVSGAVHAVRFSPDGGLIAVGGGEPAVRGEVRLFRTADGEPAGTLTGHEDVVAAIDFDRDGKRLVSAGFDRGVRLWDVESKTCLRTVPGHADIVEAVGFAPDGSWIASAGKDRTVRVIDAESGKVRLSLAAVDELHGLVVSPDGRWIVAAGTGTTLYWWDARSGEKVRTKGGHHAAVTDLSFGADGRLVASVGEDQTVRFWGSDNGAEKHAEKLPALPYAVALSPDSQRAAVACFDGWVRLYEAPGGRSQVAFLATAAPGGAAHWLAMTPAGHLIGSPKLLFDGRWKMGDAEVSRDPVWKALFDPEAVGRAARGEPVSPPQFRR